MSKKKIIIPVAVTFVFVGILGLGLILGAERFQARSDYSSKLEEAKKMLRQSFDKNKKMRDQMELFSRRQVSLLLQIREKEKQLQKNIDETKGTEKETAALREKAQLLDWVKEQMVDDQETDDIQDLVRKQREANEGMSKELSILERTQSSSWNYESDLREKFEAVLVDQKRLSALIEDLQVKLESTQAREKDYLGQVDLLSNQIETLQERRKIDSEDWLEERRRLENEYKQEMLKSTKALGQQLNKIESAWTNMKEKNADLIQEIQNLQVDREKDRQRYFYNLGVAYSYAGYFRQAAEMYQKVLEIDPQDVESHYNLGILYEEHLDENKKGIDHYKQFLKLSKDEMKRKDVKNWIRIARTEFGSHRKTRTESGKDSIKHLFFTSP